MDLMGQLGVSTETQNALREVVASCREPAGIIRSYQLTTPALLCAISLDYRYDAASNITRNIQDSAENQITGAGSFFIS